MGNMYRCNKKGESGGAKLVGTYSGNKNIDVSAYGATSASQFLLVPNSISGSPSYYRFTGATQDTISFSCSFSKGSMSLNNNVLSVSQPVLSFSGTKKEGSANPYSIGDSAGVSYSIYYVGDIS